MVTTADLRLILSRELDTEDLSLEYDTVVISPEFSRRVLDGLLVGGNDASVIDFPRPART